MKKLSESIWGDIRRQADGNSVKREDDINTLDQNGFYEYLNSKYWCNLSGHRIKSQDDIDLLVVPLYCDKKSAEVLELNFEMEKNKVYIDHGDSFSLEYRDLYEKMKDSFKTEIIKEKWENPFWGTQYERILYVSPKDGTDVTNKHFVSVIEFMLENVDEKHKNILVKK